MGHHMGEKSMRATHFRANVRADSLHPLPTPSSKTIPLFKSSHHYAKQLSVRKPRSVVWACGGLVHFESLAAVEGVDVSGRHFGGVSEKREKVMEPTGPMPADS